MPKLVGPRRSQLKNMNSQPCGQGLAACLGMAEMAAWHFCHENHFLVSNVEAKPLYRFLMARTLRFALLGQK
jgi:hypothetical protein